MVTALALTPASNADAELSVTEALEILRHAVNAIHSYDVVVEVRDERMAKSVEIGHGVTPGPYREGHSITKFVPYGPDEIRPFAMKKYRQVRQGNNGRLETLDYASGKTIEVLAGRSGDWKVRQLGSAHATLRSEPVQPLPEGMTYRSLFQTGMATTSIASVFESRKSTRVTTVINNDHIQHVIEADPEPRTKMAVFFLKVTLDSRYGFMPNEIEVAVDNGGKRTVLRRTSINRFEKVAPGVFAPMAASTTFFERSSPDTPLPYQKCELRVMQSQSKWNAAIPDQVFDLEIPAGTIVHDTWKKTTYVAGDTDVGKNLENLAKQGQRVIAATPAKSGRPDWLWLGVSGGGVALIGSLVIWWRCRRLKT